MHIVHLFGLLQLSMWSKMTQYLTSIWRRMTTVRFILYVPTTFLSSSFACVIEQNLNLDDKGTIRWNCLSILAPPARTTNKYNYAFSPLYAKSYSFIVCLQVGNEQDITMQAGRQKGALPLIRKFNEHSERLLNSALQVVLFNIPLKCAYQISRGEGSSTKRKRTTIDEVRCPTSVLFSMIDRWST